MTSRADKLTSTLKQQELYSDFLDSFAKTPIGNQLGKVVNQYSVTQALKNLVLTNTGERMFQPYVGSDITKLLFEPVTPSVLTNLQFLIQTAIKNYEPRVNVIAVNVTDEIDHNAFGVSIVYLPINSSNPVTVNFLLKRVR
jgi:phage baseplate assembly protein W